jgi:outer membrane protein
MLTPMKLNRLLPLALSAALGFTLNAAFNSSFHAQNAPSKVGFITADLALKAHPLNKDVEAIRVLLQKDIAPFATTITALQAKGTGITAKEKQDLDVATKAAEVVRNKYSDQVAPKVKKINEDVNAVIAAVATKQGFAILMDKGIAATSGLVVYADEASLDITKDVVAAVEAKK